VTEASVQPQGGTDTPAVGNVGETLRRSREARGLTVANVAQMLKLGVRQVEAMEQGRFDLLPGPAFVRGFVRNYARLLGADPAPLLEALEPDTRIERVELTPVSNAEGVMPSGGQSRMSSGPVAVVAFGLLLIVLAGWYFDWFDTAEPVEVSVPLSAPVDEPLQEQLFPPGFQGEATPPAESTVPADAVTAPATPAVAAAPVSAPLQTAPQAAAAAPQVAPAPPASSAPPPTGQARVSLRFEGESWYEVRDASGTVLMTGIGQSGLQRSVQGRTPLAVVVGNADLVRLEHNGRAVDLAPHARSGVARLSLQ
jgi:cytoskeleton protein RodZ